MVERLKATFSGTTYSGMERFAWGVHFGLEDAGTVSAAEVQAWADSLAGLVQDNLGEEWLSEHGTGTSYRNVNVQYYNLGATAVFSGAAAISPVVPGSGPMQHAPQVCRVVSLLTGLAGRRYRGRVYLPATGASMDSLGQSGVPTAMASTFATFLEEAGLAWAGGGSAFPAVYSEVAAVVTPVTAVRIGTVLDTQRRRADSLAETFQSATL